MYQQQSHTNSVELTRGFSWWKLTGCFSCAQDQTQRPLLSGCCEPSLKQLQMTPLPVQEKPLSLKRVVYWLQFWGSCSPWGTLSMCQIHVLLVGWICHSLPHQAQRILQHTVYMCHVHLYNMCRLMPVIIQLLITFLITHTIIIMHEYTDHLLLHSNVGLSVVMAMKDNGRMEG